MNNDKGKVYEAAERGFITETYWDKEINYKTVDENGLEVDCYSRVVEEIDQRKDEVDNYYKKEKMRNAFLNCVYKFQFRFLLFSVITTFVTLMLSIVSYAHKNTSNLAKFMALLDGKIAEGAYAKIYDFVNPAITNVEAYGVQNIYFNVLLVSLIASIIALIIYMIGDDHITVRWLAKLLHITPICEIKSASDKRMSRLESDLYNIQLRRHEVKYASHK